jgi:glycosyltransferase involved in cell wall biosynthesis
MIRICSSLAEAGYSVKLVGVQTNASSPLIAKKYHQKRLFTPFKKGFWFYAGYNIRLFFYLLFEKADLICCVDLDTMLPVRLAGKFKKATLVYDAHEYFSQQKEIITRPGVYRVWKWIEKTFVPKFKNGYTVSQSIAAAFKKLYGVDYEVIRNMPVSATLNTAIHKEGNLIIYQGAVNEARGLEFLIPAMETIDATLHIYGDGNFMEQTIRLVEVNNLQHKVFLKGKLLPGDLDEITQSAYIGINLVEHSGLNQYYSLANKFFDYIQHGIPQVSMNFPEYKKINDEFDIAILIDDLNIETTRNAIKKLLDDKVLYNRLQQNCLKARQILNWQQEEKKLIQFYKNLLG